MATLAERNRNPLNIRYTGAGWQGSLGAGAKGHGGAFVAFKSPDWGYRAALKNMEHIQRKRGAKTIRDLIYVWAPPKDRNNTAAYVARVAQMMGVSPDTPLNLRDPKFAIPLMRAMTVVEAGKDPYSDAIRQAGFSRFVGGPVARQSFDPLSTGTAQTQTASMSSAGPTLTAKSVGGQTPVQQQNTGLALALSGQSKVPSYASAMMKDALAGKVLHPVDAIGRIAQFGAGMYAQKNAERENAARRVALVNALTGGKLTPEAMIASGDPSMRALGMAKMAQAAQDKRSAAEAQRREFEYKRTRSDKLADSQKAFERQKELAGLKGQADAGKEGFKRETKLRSEFETATKTFRGVRDGYSRVNDGAKLGTGAGDIGVVFGYMKMIDPASTVREGEFATAENSAGIAAKVRNTYNKLMNGERLDPKQRAMFVAAAQRYYKTEVGKYDRMVKHYTGLAKKYGLDPSRVVREMKAQEKKQSKQSDGEQKILRYNPETGELE